MSLNPDHINGDWSRYQRLVLTELERHDRSLENINRKIDSLILNSELTKRESDKIKLLESRIEELEKADLATDTIRKYRNWLFALAITLLTSIIIPIILFVLQNDTPG